MAGFTLRKAERRKAKVRIALTGPSGSGKTMGALRLAKGMVEALGLPVEGSIGLIDSERGSAELYANVVPFTVVDLTPPYSPPRYMEALALLEQHKFPIIIIDQISHAWAGEGGLLERVDSWKAGAKNAMSAWTQATPEQQRFVDALLNSPAHIIATMRSKTEWVIEEEIDRNGRKRQVPKKIGMAPVQRDGIEYEFTCVLDIEKDGHSATASKDRTGLFDEKRMQLTEKAGHQLVEWMNSGGPERFEAAQEKQLAAKVEAQRPLVDRIVSAHRQAEKARAEDPPEAGFGSSQPRTDAGMDGHDGAEPDDERPYGAPLTQDQLKLLHVKIGDKARNLKVTPERIKETLLASYNVKSSKDLGQTIWSGLLTQLLKMRTADLLPPAEAAQEGQS